VWASGPVWTGAEKLAPPGFDHRTVQPVGSGSNLIVYISVNLVIMLCLMTYLTADVNKDLRDITEVVVAHFILLFMNFSRMTQ
jgi:hypothetical protein